jgi:hypothetical protein
MLTQHSCDVYRNSAVGTNGRKTKTLQASAVPCTFIPMEAQAAIRNGFTVGKGYDVFFNDGADVQVGDRLVRDSQNYAVSAAMPYPGFGDVSHVHVLANLEVH